MVPRAVLEEWRWNARASGGPCVVSPGTWMMLQWSVSSWAVGLLLKLLGVHSLGPDLTPFGWMKLSVVAPSLPCPTAQMINGIYSTVITLRMLERDVQVRGQPVPHLRGWGGGRGLRSPQGNKGVLEKGLVWPVALSWDVHCWFPRFPSKARWEPATA